MRWLLATTLLVACGGGGSDPVRDAGPTPDASNVDAANGVTCSRDFCDPIERCCIEQIKPPQVSYFCVADEPAGICQGSEFDCDGPEDCADGEVCCGANASTCTPVGQCSGSTICHSISHCPPGSVRCAETPLMLLRICI